MSSDSSAIIAPRRAVARRVEVMAIGNTSGEAGRRPKFRALETRYGRPQGGRVTWQGGPASIALNPSTWLIL
eukprot:3955121-Prymnesium_polylepis.1